MKEKVELPPAARVLRIYAHIYYILRGKGIFFYLHRESFICSGATASERERKSGYAAADISTQAGSLETFELLAKVEQSS